jgi:GT2 family glycosyltransferase
MDVSIIIVSYNTKDLLRNCLVSIYEQTAGLVFEIIVSDNGSTDGSLEMIKKEFGQVILIENNANLGFGAANNQGLNIAKGKYIFYLNSDTVLLNNAVKIFFYFWEKYSEPDKLGALGCNLLDAKGEIVKSYGNFPTIYLEIKLLIFLICRCVIIALAYLCKIDYHRFLRKNEIVAKIGSVDFISGAAFFVRNDKSEYFSEDFFLYYEETDLQYRLNKANRRRVLIDGPLICHLERKSDASINVFKLCGGMSLIYSSFSRIIYLKKRGVSRVGIIIIKILTMILFVNPVLFLKTKRYIRKLMVA